MATIGEIALKGVGYAITEFELNGKTAMVHREQVEQFATPFSTVGEQTQKRITSYTAVKYGMVFRQRCKSLA